MDREPRIVLSGIGGAVLGGVVGTLFVLGDGMGAFATAFYIGGVLGGIGVAGVYARLTR